MADQELEIDLRLYILLLFQHWYLILLVAAVAAVSAYLVTASMPPYYEATALVAITQPNYTLEFDPRIQTLDGEKPFYKAYPEIARSIDLVAIVFAALDPIPEGIDTPARLARHMDAVSGVDPSLLHLTVTMPTPQDAARIANTWAATFIQQAHAIYGSHSEDEVRFFVMQLAENQIKLEQAEQELVAFEATNELAILQNQLNTLKETHLRYLKQQQDNAFVIRDLAGLQLNLQTQDPGAPATFADQLSLLSLQTAAYAAGSQLPVDLQLVDTTTMAGQTVGDQLRVLDDLITTLQDQNVTNTRHIEALNPQITALQQQIKALEIEQTRLTRNLSVKRDMDTALARKVEEVTMASQEAPSEFRHAGSAIAPEKPSGPSKMINTALAGISAAFLCVAALVFREYMQHGVVSVKHKAQKYGLRHLFGGNGDMKAKESQDIKELGMQES